MRTTCIQGLISLSLTPADTGSGARVHLITKSPRHKYSINRMPCYLPNWYIVKYHDNCHNEVNYHNSNHLTFQTLLHIAILSLQKYGNGVKEISQIKQKIRVKCFTDCETNHLYGVC